VSLTDRSATHEATAEMHRNAPVTVFEPWKRSGLARLHELWRHRNYVPYFGKILVRRRYWGTWLGVFWLFRPVLDVASRALLFGGFLQVQSGDRPYFVFLLVGTSAWVLFERTMFWATRSIQMNGSVHTRLAVPRLPTVVSASIPALLDFVLLMTLGTLTVGYYWLTRGTLYVAPIGQWPIALLGIVMLLAFGVAIGLYTAPLAVYARDIRFSLAYIFQAWYFLTPVIYPISSLPVQYRVIAELNPITAPVEFVKYGLLSTSLPSTTSVIVSVCTLLVVGTIGLRFFSGFEGRAVARM
jgi:lipopolysaccharide transport system permease protein